MNQDIAALGAVAKQFALLAETLERRSAAADERLAQIEQRFTQTINAIEAKVERIIQGSGQQIAHSSRQSVDSAIASGVNDLRKAGEDYKSQISSSTKTLSVSLMQAMTHLRRHVGIAYAAVTGAILLVFAGGALLLWYQHQSYEDALVRTEAAQISADTVALYAQVGVSSCGGQPCLRLDPKAPHWGTHGEFILLAPKTGR